MSTGTEDEDSSVKKFFDVQLEDLKKDWLTSVSSMPTPRPAPVPPPTQRAERPNQWLAILAVILPTVTIIAALTWSGGGTAEAFSSLRGTVSSGMSKMSDKIDQGVDRDLKVAATITRLTTLLETVIKNQNGIAIQLGKAEGMQEAQGLAMVRVEGLVDVGIADRKAIHENLIRIEFFQKQDTTILGTTKRRVSRIEDVLGKELFKQPKGDNE